MARITIPKKDSLDDNASPDLCMVCGSNASQPDLTSNISASYTSPMAILGIFFGLPGILILSIIMRKTHPVRIKQCSDCAPHRKRLGMFLGLNWLICLVLLFMGAGMVGSSSPGHDGLAMLGGLAMMAAFIYPICYWFFYSRRYNISCQGIDAENVVLNLPNSNYGGNFQSFLRPKPADQVQMSCPKCRSMIPSDANFCSSCGQSI